ncbi:MAG: hypothetical protein KME67_15450 [Candidatus Thiodiazotropha sp. (ex Codakia orbicularis)]|nr:hypothetical protein [Candidatus Thiodiazotropha sp. (ex Codakia orbicularis)]
MPVEVNLGGFGVGMTQEGAGIDALLAVEMCAESADLVEGRALWFGGLVEQPGGVSRL